MAIIKKTNNGKYWQGDPGIHTRGWREHERMRSLWKCWQLLKNVKESYHVTQQAIQLLTIYLRDASTQQLSHKFSEKHYLQ